MITRTYFFAYIRSVEGGGVAYGQGDMSHTSWLPKPADELIKKVKEWLGKNHEHTNECSIISFSRIS